MSNLCIKHNFLWINLRFIKLLNLIISTKLNTPPNQHKPQGKIVTLWLRVRFEGVTGLTVLHDRERLPNMNLTAFNKLHFLSILSFDRSLLCTFDEDRVYYYYLRSFFTIWVAHVYFQSFYVFVLLFNKLLP